MTEWNTTSIDTLDEDFTVQSENDKFVSGNIFLVPLKRTINKNPVSISVKSSIQEVLKFLQEHNQGAVLLTEYETKLKGIITERDFLLKVFGKHVLTEGPIPAEQFMTPNPHTLLGKHFMAYAINNMNHFHYRNIVLVDEDRVPLSVVSIMDIFKYVADYLFCEDGDE